MTKQTIQTATLGAWHAKPCPTGRSIVILAAADDAYVAEIRHEPLQQSGFAMAGGSTSQDRTRARLIIAAPDLLAACEAMYENQRDDPGFWQSTTAIKARAAMAKAGRIID